MEVLLVLIFVLCIAQNSIMESAAEIEILSYEDIRKLNASCHPRDSCAETRAGNSPGILSDYACSCDRLCSKLGTCCIDSPHRNTLSPTVKPRCRTVEESSTPEGFYMVDRCLLNGTFHPIWESLCQDEWNGEDNILKLAPVTSLFTSMTYKNYFCFRCHETTHEFLFWNVELRSHYNGSGVVAENANFGVVYDHDNKTWLATVGEEGVSIPVKLKFEIPRSIKSLALRCEPGVISNCSDSWSEESARYICNAYTAILYIRKDGSVLKYKNAHCALCNFESLEDMVCQDIPPITPPTKTFTYSFAYLLDINLSNGERVGKKKKCEENFVWNPYDQKCRKITCAIPDYIIKDGQCKPP